MFKELEQKRMPLDHKVKTIYFGGGTPSLAPKKLLEKYLNKILSTYAKAQEEIEISLEINPKTLDLSDIKDLLSMGFNRFSLGVQSFQDKFLNSCGRDHSAKDSIKDLENFSSLNLNYSADLLFGLPNQSLKDLEYDLNILTSFNPPHVSPYNLTLPEKHFFNKGRASDEDQAEMMSLITEKLKEVEIRRYEVSNYSKPGSESKHNLSYWTDTPYWGLGMGAHSYFKNESDWGVRSWNSGNFKTYESFCSSGNKDFQKSETLKPHESLTDFCHTSLRSIIGLNKDLLSQKYGALLPKDLWSTLETLVSKDLLSYDSLSWRLTEKGFKVPNQVFNELCFLKL